MYKSLYRKKSVIHSMHIALGFQHFSLDPLAWDQLSNLLFLHFIAQSRFLKRSSGDLKWDYHQAVVVVAFVFLLIFVFVFVLVFVFVFIFVFAFAFEFVFVIVFALIPSGVLLRSISRQSASRKCKCPLYLL